MCGFYENLTYYDTRTEKEVQTKGENTVVATKIGQRRIGDLKKLSTNKKENITDTANIYYAPEYNTSNQDEITVYLGNNGVLKLVPNNDEIEINNPQTGFMISFNILLILGVPVVIYLYSKRNKKIYKLD